MMKLKVKSFGSIYGEDKGTGYAGNVWDKNGLSPTINTSQGGNRQPMIIAMRGRNPDNPSDRRAGIELEQRLEPNREGICNSLTTVNKDNLVLEACAIRMVRTEEGKALRKKYESHEIKHGFNEHRIPELRSDGYVNTLSTVQKDNLIMETVKIKQATKQGYAECKIGGVADLSYPESKTRRGRVQDGGDTSPTLTAGEGGIHRIESEYRIRKLTPLECWRLMGFTDEEFKAAESVNSNTQLYKQAGNSIVVDVLVGIFKKIMEVEDMAEKESSTKCEKYGRFTCEAIEVDKMIDLVKFREAEPELFEELAADYPAEKINYFYSVSGE